jgi:hypothetical protein
MIFLYVAILILVFELGMLYGKFLEEDKSTTYIFNGRLIKDERVKELLKLTQYDGSMQSYNPKSPKEGAD